MDTLKPGAVVPVHESPGLWQFTVCTKAGRELLHDSEFGSAVAAKQAMRKFVQRWNNKQKKKAG
jgi:hypothetical protein